MAIGRDNGDQIGGVFHQGAEILFAAGQLVHQLEFVLAQADGVDHGVMVQSTDDQDVGKIDQQQDPDHDADGAAMVEDVDGGRDDNAQGKGQHRWPDGGLGGGDPCGDAADEEQDNRAFQGGAGDEE